MSNYQFRPMRLGNGQPLDLSGDWLTAKQQLKSLSMSDVVLGDPALLRYWTAANYDDQPPSDWPGASSSSSQPAADDAGGASRPTIPQSSASTSESADAGAAVSSEAAGVSASRPTGRRGIGTIALDSLQAILDGIGVADPTPTVDLANAAISVVRAVGDPERRGEHLTNAGISAVSAVPYVGDIAKTAKVGRYGELASNIAGFAGAGQKATKAGSEAASGAAAAAHASGQSNGLAGAAQQGAAQNLGAMIGGLIGNQGQQTQQPQPQAGGQGGGGQPPTNPPAPPATPPSPGGQPPGGNPATQNAANQSFANIVQQFTGGMDQIVKNLPGFVSVVMKGTEYFIGFNAALYAANRLQLAANDHLRKYSGVIANAYGQLQLGRTRRDIANSDVYGGNLADLADQQNRFEQNLNEFTRPLTQFTILAQTYLTWGVNLLLEVIDAVEPITEAAEFWMKLAVSDKNRTGTGKNLAQQLIDGLRQQQAQAERARQNAGPNKADKNGI